MTAGGAARGPDAAAQLARALALHQAGRLDAAEPLYRALLASDPDDVDAQHLLGVLWHRSGRIEAGLALIERALAARPHDPALHSNRGAALRDLGRHSDALASFDAALQRDPVHAIAANNRAAALLDLGRADAALGACDAILARLPDDLTAHYHRGRSLQDLGRAEPALAAYQRSRGGRPDFVPALDAELGLLRGLGRHREALAHAERLLALTPPDAERWHGHASLLLELGQPPAALRSLERALALAPDHAASHHDAGHAWIALGRPDLALAPYARAMALAPGLPFLHGQWLHTRLKVCDWRDLAAETARLADAIEAGAPATAPFPTTLLALDEAQQLRVARGYVRHRHGEPVTALPMWPRGPRIRLGYFSPDFHQHPLAMLCAGLFEAHDRDRVEVIAFSYGPPREDALRARLRAGFDRFLDVREDTDAQIVALARSLRVDIAIDLAGPTQDSRGGIFAARAAPVQVAMIGFPGSSGAAHIDHLIADAQVVPKGHEAHYSEHVVRLPHSYYANDDGRAPAGPAPSRASVGLPERGVVFCAFNQNAKITPAVFALWMGLLREIDASVLWLLQDNPLASANLRAAAQRDGIDPTRLVFAPRVAPAEHLARHGCADLYLDTLPYNGHTSACDALWADLPVLTRVGATFAGRVGASLLHAAGLPELVTHSALGYADLARRLAREPALLAGYRERLRAGRTRCALFDTARYARDLEAAYAAMLDPPPPASL
ncbi:MAG: tetratricopeptide repeat protein [Burkholderiaceae bacterium]